MREKLIAFLKAAGFIKADNEQQIIAELDKQDFLKTPAAPSPNGDDTINKILLSISDTKTKDAVGAIVTAFQLENKALAQEIKTLNTAISQERDERVKAMNTRIENEKTEGKKKTDAAVDKAITEGRFNESQKDYLTKLATADLVSFESLVKNTPVNKSFLTEQQAKGKKPGEKNNNVTTEKTETRNNLLDPLSRGGDATVLGKIKEFSNVTE